MLQDHESPTLEMNSYILQTVSYHPTLDIVVHCNSLLNSPIFVLELDIPNIADITYLFGRTKSEGHIA